MIIRNPPKITFHKSILKYIEVDLWNWLKDISVGLLKINFQENFQSFTVEDITIPAGQEIAITNAFRNAYPGVIPRYRIIVRQQGNAIITDGPTVWTADQVFLQNVSGVDATSVTVIFFK